MARINLLPWREQRRELQRKEFLFTLGAVAGVGLVVMLLAGWMVQQKIDDQAGRNAYLTTHIAELDKKVAEIRDLQTRRNELIDRMQVIQNLQGTRPVIVRIFDEIVRTLPDGVFYRGIQSAGNTITIQGTAESNNRVSSLMRRLDASEWFANPTLKGVKANTEFGEQGNDFDLTITVTMPGAVIEEGQGG